MSTVTSTSTGSKVNPYDIILANKGFMTLSTKDGTGVQIAELKDLEIKLTSDTKEIGLMNSATKGEVNVSYKGDITFEINKIYSRFKPNILECCKNLQPFVFNLEATVYNPNASGEETISISEAWIKGDIPLFALKSENDFLSEKYEAGFSVENASFIDIIDDDNDWTSLSSSTS